MAFNTAVFKTRALTSLVFVAVMLAGLLINQWTFFLLFSAIHFGCWVEYQKLIGKINPSYVSINPLHRYGIMLAGWGFMLLMTSGAYKIGYLNIQVSGKRLLYIMPLVVVLSEIFFTKGKLDFQRLGYSMLGIAYISLPCGLLVQIWSKGIGFETDFGFIPVMLLIASIWINDTMAYLVGSFIGKTPFSKVSPKKTWEGTAGGAVLAVVVVSLLSKLVLGTDILLVMFMVLIAVVFGTMGDLLESWLKRKANVKDSGSIMPGHGGFLDRFDSLLIATPFVWLYVEFVL